MHFILKTDEAEQRMKRKDNYADLPDVRDGLTYNERLVLYCLHELQRERNDRNVPTAMLYGRVVEHINVSVNELQLILQRLIGKELPRG
ncbi:MAG TPA: hypothetical protein VFM46_11100 [Pseudomonadales bacterium]|nr:hypothetical protein [Pseudomonadales bacterium]